MRGPIIGNSFLVTSFPLECIALSSLASCLGSLQSMSRSIPYSLFFTLWTAAVSKVRRAVTHPRCTCFAITDSISACLYLSLKDVFMLRQIGVFAPVLMFEAQRIISNLVCGTSASDLCVNKFSGSISEEISIFITKASNNSPFQLAEPLPVRRDLP